MLNRVGIITVFQVVKSVVKLNEVCEAFNLIDLFLKYARVFFVETLLFSKCFSRVVKVVVALYDNLIQIMFWRNEVLVFSPNLHALKQVTNVYLIINFANVAVKFNFFLI